MGPSAESPSTSTIWESKNSGKKSPNSGPTCTPSKRKNTTKNKKSTDKNTTSTNSANVYPSTWANSPRTREPSKSEPPSAPQNLPSNRPHLLLLLFCRYFFVNFLVLHTSLFSPLLRHDVMQRHVIT